MLQKDISIMYFPFCITGIYASKEKYNRKFKDTITNIASITNSPSVLHIPLYIFILNLLLFKFFHAFREDNEILSCFSLAV